MDQPEEACGEVQYMLQYDTFHQTTTAALQVTPCATMEMCTLAWQSAAFLRPFSRVKEDARKRTVRVVFDRLVTQTLSQRAIGVLSSPQLFKSLIELAP